METSTGGPKSSLRAGALGVGAITFFVVSAAGPLVTVAGGAPLGMLLGDGPGMPAAYLVATALLVVFCVGYTAMARHVRDAGALYAFVRRGLGPMAGGASAMVAVVSYNAMQIGIYGMFGHAAASLLATVWGLVVPWWGVALAGMAAIAVCGYRQIDLSAKILGLLVIAEYLCVLLLDLLILRRGGDAGIGLGPFAPSAFLTGAPAIGLLFCFASFIGFEATTIYSEEAKDPHRTVPLATYASVMLIGGFYAFTTWCMVLGAGERHLLGVLRAASDPTRLLFLLSDRYADPRLTLVLGVLFVTSVFAGLLAFHNAIARYFFALGRDRLLPAGLGETHGVYRSPHRGSLLQTAIALVVVSGFAICGQDPVLALFSWLTNVGTLGILVLMALASFAVPAFFARRTDLGESVLARLVAPMIAGAALSGVAALAAANFGLLTGASASLAYLLPGIVAAAALIGAALGASSPRPDTP